MSKDPNYLDPTRKLFTDFADVLLEVALGVTPDQVTELIEYVTDEQNQWEVDSPGWMVLEAFKKFIRASEKDCEG